MASSKRIKGYIIGPYDSASNWEASTRILSKGEKVYAKVSNGDVRSKTGDGTKAFHKLPYDDEALYESLRGKAASDLSNVSNANFLAKASAAGLGVGSGNSTVVSTQRPADQGENDTWLEVLSAE